MRKIVVLILATIMLLSLAACGAPGNTPESTPEDSVAPTSAPELSETVTFADPVLEDIVRGIIGKPDGSITASDVRSITRLDLSNVYQQFISDNAVIKSIGGLEYFTDLQYLDLSGHEIEDISPLAALTKLKVLVLSGCKASDYTPLSGLIGLKYLRLDNSTITDAAPLAGLTNLKRLYLTGCDLKYTPLENIYPSLEDKDFIIATTLAEYGFYMDDERKQAIYGSEPSPVSVRINHTEWGNPGEDSMRNCVRTVFEQNGYKVDIGYYPEFDTYVVLGFKDGEFVLNYLYFAADGSFGIDDKFGDRETVESVVREIFPDADGDMLRAPIDFFNTALKNALGKTATELYAMSFDENYRAPSPYVKLGFEFQDWAGRYEYQKDSLIIQVYRKEWAQQTAGEQVVDSISFVDKDFKGYELAIFYDASTPDHYGMHLEKDGVRVCSNILASTRKLDIAPQDMEVYISVFGGDGSDLGERILSYYEETFQELFGMSVEELFTLSAD